MKPAEWAYGSLEQIEKTDFFCQEFNDVFKIARQALKMRIPQRPRIGKGPFKCYRYCPTCDRILNVSERRPYCDMCGQAIAWEGGAAVRQKQK